MTGPEIAPKTGRTTVEVNGRHYNWPASCVVVICCDGSEPEYMDVALEKGGMPHLASIIEGGEYLIGDCVIPSFTNPNNVSIVTGCPPSIHGICGNYFFDRKRGEEVLMNDPEFLRAPTIFEGFYNEGANIAIVTAKDKLRLLLGNGLEFDQGRAVCLSAERADQCRLSENGIENIVELIGMPVPDVYSLELSEFVFAAGVHLLQNLKPDLMYLSTTDYIQHKYAPGTEGANAFYSMMDRYLKALHDSGSVVVLTADHGMKHKHRSDGQPDVLYLQELIDQWLGPNKARVILPITDPYVLHHGALGSFATVYFDDNVNIPEVMAKLLETDGVDLVLNNEESCKTFELPEDRLGDIVVIARENKVLGTSHDRHDLTLLREPLRSHGGISEQKIPMIVNRPVKDSPRPLRNFDAFSVALNNILDD